jgi:hypothetical protein
VALKKVRAESPVKQRLYLHKLCVFYNVVFNFVSLSKGCLPAYSFSKSQRQRHFFIYNTKQTNMDTPASITRSITSGCRMLDVVDVDPAGIIVGAGVNVVTGSSGNKFSYFKLPIFQLKFEVSRYFTRKQLK